MTTSILPSLKGSIRTHNTTSFAVAYGDATALFLDGTHTIGGRRKEKFEQARGRAQTALAYTDEPVEKLLAAQFLSVLKLAEQRGWDF